MGQSEDPFEEGEDYRDDGEAHQNADEGFGEGGRDGVVAEAYQLLDRRRGRLGIGEVDAVIAIGGGVDHVAEEDGRLIGRLGLGRVIVPIGYGRGGRDELKRGVFAVLVGLVVPDGVVVIGRLDGQNARLDVGVGLGEGIFVALLPVGPDDEQSRGALDRLAGFLVGRVLGGVVDAVVNQVLESLGVFVAIGKGDDDDRDLVFPHVDVLYPGFLPVDDVGEDVGVRVIVVAGVGGAELIILAGEGEVLLQIGVLGFRIVLGAQRDGDRVETLGLHRILAHAPVVEPVFELLGDVLDDRGAGGVDVGFVQEIRVIALKRILDVVGGAEIEGPALGVGQIGIEVLDDRGRRGPDPDEGGGAEEYIGEIAAHCVLPFVSSGGPSPGFPMNY